MSAVQDGMGQRQEEVRGLLPRLSWPWRWHLPLFDEPLALIGYVMGVLTCYLAATGWEAAHTELTAKDITLFAALTCCGAICVEATMRLGQPIGVSRDLLSAWWLPVALLLPPLFALAAPAILGLLIHVRVHRGAVYRRVFSTAALGLSGACASALFRWLTQVAVEGKSAALLTLTYPGPNVWRMSPRQAEIAVACAIVFAVLNTCLVAVAAWLVDSDSRLVDMLWDRERMLLDLTETCVGILVTISCALSPLLLIVALPPVVLLQRSLLHSQLKAQARTDPKTGVLNVGAWQAEAILSIARAQRRGEPLAVLLADVDHFKNVNDSHGHLVGDEVLKMLATEMRAQVRESDLVGRFGGEEFAILVANTTPEDAFLVADRIRRSAAVAKVLDQDTIVGVTVSIGVAALGSHGDDLFELLGAADVALYAAKNKGRDRVCLYDPAYAAPAGPARKAAAERDS